MTTYDDESVAQEREVHWVPGSGEFNMTGPYLTDTATCPICKCPNDFEFVESYASPVRCTLGCGHLRFRELREGDNWYGFSEKDRAQNDAETPH